MGRKNGPSKKNAVLSSLDADALRVLVVALRVHNAALQRENDGLKAANEAYKTENKGLRMEFVALRAAAAGGVDSGAIAKPDSDVAGILLVENDAQILPVELLAMIGDYFAPGSRSLLNLARTCRQLYGLLLKRLYKSFSAESIYRNFGNAKSFQKRGSWLPSGFDVVERLDAVPGPSNETFRRGELVRRVQNSVLELSCGWELMHTHTFKHIQLPMLRALTMVLEKAPLQGLMAWRGAPNLQTLKLQGYPNVKIMNWFNACLPAATRVDLDFFDGEHWEPATMSPQFVARIRSWTCHDVSLVTRAIANLSTFSPEEIVCPVGMIDYELEEPMLMSVEDWNLLIRLPKLRRLHLNRLSSQLILTTPQTLDELKVESLELDLRTAHELAALATWLQSAPTHTRLLLRHRHRCVDQIGLDEYSYYLKELAMWETVPGFKCDRTAEELKADWTVYLAAEEL